MPAKCKPNAGRRENLTNEGKGRVKGVPNKNTTAIKDMIVAALDKAGGIDYLLKQSGENPVAFMGLVGKVLPLQITGADGGAIEIRAVERRFIHAEPLKLVHDASA